jgi:hypothetical protein
VLAAIRQERGEGLLPGLQQGFARTLARRSDSSLLLVGTVGDEVAGYGLAKLFEARACSSGPTCVSRAECRIGGRVSWRGA